MQSAYDDAKRVVFYYYLLLFLKIRVFFSHSPTVTPLLEVPKNRCNNSSYACIQSFFSISFFFFDLR